MLRHIVLINSVFNAFMKWFKFKILTHVLFVEDLLGMKKVIILNNTNEKTTNIYFIVILVVFIKFIINNYKFIEE